MSWPEKYRPQSFLEVKGQDEAIRNIKNFIENFYLGKLSKTGKKALILHGSPGVGKTTLAHVIAKEFNSEIFELNASDLRNKANLQQTLKPAIEQKSLVSKNKIILIDEVDGISAYADWGGMSQILYLIENTTYPVIITANDIWDKKFYDLRKKSEVVKLKEIDYKTIKGILIEILRKEGKFVNNETLTEIAVKVKGDLRAAINDIQIESGIRPFSSKVPISERNKETDIFNSLKMIFKGKPTKEMLEIYDSVNMNLDEIMLWVEENIPREYKGEELARAYDLLSKADIFKGRIYKQQYWRFLVYENIFLSFGISASKNPLKPIGSGFTSYKKPDRILKIWLKNKKNEKKKTIAKKYARYVHIGQKRAMRDFPVIKKILQNKNVQNELKLSDEEVEYVMR